MARTCSFRCANEMEPYDTIADQFETKKLMNSTDAFSSVPNASYISLFFSERVHDVKIVACSPREQDLVSIDVDLLESRIDNRPILRSVYCYHVLKHFHGKVIVFCAINSSTFIDYGQVIAYAVILLHLVVEADLCRGMRIHQRATRPPLW